MFPARFVGHLGFRRSMAIRPLMAQAERTDMREVLRSGCEANLRDQREWHGSNAPRASLQHRYSERLGPVRDRRQSPGIGEWALRITLGLRQ